MLWQKLGSLYKKGWAGLKRFIPFDVSGKQGVRIGNEYRMAQLCDGDA